MGRRELVHALEEGLLRRGILKGEIGPQRVLVDPGLEFRVFEEGLDLRAEDEMSPVGEGIVEGLDAEGIPRAVEGVRLRVPDDEREHAAELFRRLLAPFLEAVENDLRVAPGTEHVTLRDELVPELHEIVDLAVVDDHHGAVLVVHGLGSGREVDDGKAAEPEGDGVMVAPAADVVAVRIRASVDDPVRHFADDRFPPVDDPGKACKTAHISKNLSDVNSPGCVLSLYHIPGRK